VQGGHPISEEENKAIISRYREEVWNEGIPDAVVVQRLTLRGTQQGDLIGIPPIGRQATVAVIAIFCLAEGTIAERWAWCDSRPAT